MGLTLLAIDSAGGAGSAAVWRDGAVLAARRLVTDRGHAAHLAPLVRSVLADAGTAAAELDAVVATVGPGSFTGLRVGLALAQGIAIAAAIPAWGISSFDVHARAAGGARPLLLAIDSRREEVFVRILTKEGAGEPFVATPSGIAARLSGWGAAAPIAVAGDAARLVAAALSASGVPAIVVHDGPADAAVLAAAAAAMLAAGQPLLPPRPVYLRPPDVSLPPAAA
ncbi:tRNA threonylcarbamoyladenosine biosynthesis protein TsaB [Stella humosa]|uniref:tRNA threonylcarbamoyladenosine biosynthesis protein TsaB n=1 Tax=Stella humosa TaxID=94 RepID=A0A3N1LHJ7_9PROT|nr:tRNA (adenosine(37)-N6)-threonylcarbamoyltransferase complex dimerization subunit type 1 TsaB [Stella humosa]ROP90997.1 tRNA threonylcarbamoyladenosine biosynthesis protein TsaB [Stella humosa]BBK34653.1 tRNA (adenosine(37)-N6)-threonylcarbamoyltransferase complex dimerization subunit type 1 TsaB [Stella humosa]